MKFLIIFLLIFSTKLYSNDQKLRESNFLENTLYIRDIELDADKIGDKIVGGIIMDETTTKFISKVKSISPEIVFLNAKDLKQVVLMINKNGVYLKGDLICTWQSGDYNFNITGGYGQTLSFKCPDDLPFFTMERIHRSKRKAIHFYVSYYSKKKNFYIVKFRDMNLVYSPKNLNFYKEGLSHNSYIEYLSEKLKGTLFNKLKKDLLNTSNNDSKQVAKYFKRLNSKNFDSLDEPINQIWESIYGNSPFLCKNGKTERLNSYEIANCIFSNNKLHDELKKCLELYPNFTYLELSKISNLNKQVAIYSIDAIDKLFKKNNNIVIKTKGDFFQCTFENVKDNWYVSYFEPDYSYIINLIDEKKIKMKGPALWPITDLRADKGAELYKFYIMSDRVEVFNKFKSDLKEQMKGANFKSGLIELIKNQSLDTATKQK